MSSDNLQIDFQSNELPLVTFVILTFNQEDYVGEAIEAAFSQTYSPLEIVISDDASTDATSDIIRSMVGKYKGLHKIVFNINERNLGIGAHVNKVFQMASGHFLIIAAGDDISAADRTKLTVDRWLEKGRRPSMIYCAAEVIDADGNYVGQLDTALPNISHETSTLIEHSPIKKPLLMGACAAYSKAVISEFGPLMDNLGIEDIPLTIRSSQMGGIECISKSLVRYRRGVSVWLPKKLPGEAFDRHFYRMAHRVRENHKVAKQILHDLEKSENQGAILSAKKRLMSLQFSLDSLENGRFCLGNYLYISYKTRYWRQNMVPAILFEFPRIHKIAFLLAGFIRRLY